MTSRPVRDVTDRTSMSSATARREHSCVQRSQGYPSMHLSVLPRLIGLYLVIGLCTDYIRPDKGVLVGTATKTESSTVCP